MKIQSTNETELVRLMGAKCKSSIARAKAILECITGVVDEQAELWVLLVKKWGTVENDTEIPATAEYNDIAMSAIDAATQGWLEGCVVDLIRAVLERLRMSGDVAAMLREAVENIEDKAEQVIFLASVLNAGSRGFLPYVTPSTLLTDEEVEAFNKEMSEQRLLVVRLFDHQTSLSSNITTAAAFLDVIEGEDDPKKRVYLIALAMQTLKNRAEPRPNIKMASVDGLGGLKALMEALDLHSPNICPLCPDFSTCQKPQAEEARAQRHLDVM